MSYQQIQEERPNVTEQFLLNRMKSFPIVIKQSSSSQIPSLPITTEQLSWNRLMSFAKTQSTEGDSSIRAKSFTSLQHSEIDRSTPPPLTNQSPSKDNSSKVLYRYKSDESTPSSSIPSCLKGQSNSVDKTTRFLVTPSISGSTKNIPSRTRKKNIKQSIKKEVYQILNKYYVQDIEERKEIVKYLLRDLNKNNNAKDTNQTPTKAKKSETILKLVHDGNSYFEKNTHKNGKNRLSMLAGQRIQALHTQCGISFEKLPLAVSFFLELFFGEIEASVGKKLILCSKTYDAYAHITMKTIKDNFLEKFNDDRTNPKNFQSAYLIVDSSQAGDRNVTLKALITQNGNGKIEVNALHTDMVYSKKAMNAGEKSVTSIIDEYHRILMIIQGATSDKFGEGEAKAILKQCDKYANGVHAANPALLTYPSSVDLNSTYCFGYSFRLDRWKRCDMHSAERILLPLLQVIGGKSGQTNIYSILQNIFKFGYYCKKYWPQIYAVLAIIFSDRDCDEIRQTFINSDGKSNFDDMAEIYNNINVDIIQNIKGKEEDEFSFLSSANIPEELRDKFGNICGSRWMSFVRQSEKLISRLDIEAPEQMIKMVQDEIPQSQEDFDKLFGIATCFSDKTKVSLWCLMFYYISHYAAGGKTGDLRKNGMEVCAFLCCPSFRVGLSICSTIYPVELEWAKFFNSKTKINDKTACISTRVIESVSFYRKILNWTHQLKTNWKSLFPGTIALLDSDNLVFQDESQLPQLIETIDNMMSEVVPEIFDRSKKVYIFPLLKIGFSFNLVFDPIVSRAYVATLLNSLKFLNLLPSEQQAKYDIFDCNIDDDDLAYPELSMKDFVSLIENDLTCNRERTEAHVYALGLHNMPMIKELLQITSGKFLELISKLEPPWNAGDDFSLIFGQCEKAFPFIVESLIKNYGACPIASTIIEQMFCYVQPIVKISNKSEQSVNDSIDQMVEVRGSFAREQSYILGVEKKILRSKTSMRKFNEHVTNYMRDVDTNTSKKRKRRPKKGEGKRHKEFMRAAPSVMKEHYSNKRNKKDVQSGSALVASVSVCNRKFISRESEADQKPSDEFDKIAKEVKVSDIRSELIDAFADTFKTSEMRKLINGTRAVMKSGDPSDYAYLKDIYADYLRQRESNNGAPLSWTYKHKQNKDPESSFSYFAKE